MVGSVSTSTPRLGETIMVLRINLAASAWLDAARAAIDPPRPIRALLGGRTRIETSVDDAADSVVWASRLEGWSDDAAPPLSTYRLGD